MRPCSIRFLFLLATSLIDHAHSAGLYFPSIPEDPYAFPKYRLSFLNGFSLPNATAQRWLTEGLKGGEAEFLGKEYTSADRVNALSPKAIEPGHPVATSNLPVGGTDSVHSDDVGLTVSSQAREPTLQLMRINAKSSYLCLIPPPPLPSPPTSNENRASASAVRSPASSWELLQPMSQGCLYYTLGWFTYAYCHNKYVKQFREAAHTHPHPPGGRIPQEDPEWESYYLGVAPSPEATGSDVASSEQIAAANKLELARGAGQRYLLQRWEDGTVCDKTNQPRKIEVQFHCSMTTPDKILLIKETSVCAYVLVIHTPRLCGEPGFKSERASQEESVLRCREVLSDEAYAVEQAARIAATSPNSDRKDKHMTKDGSDGASTAKRTAAPYVESMHPFRVGPGERPRAAVPAPSPAPPATSIEAALAKEGGGDGKEAAAAALKKTKIRDSADVIRKAIKSLLKVDIPEDGIEIVVDDGEGETSSTSEKGKSETKSDDSEAKTGSKPASKEGILAEIFGSDAEDVVTVKGEDGVTSYFIVDGVEERDDLNHFASLLGNAAADGGGERLKAIRKRLLEALTNSRNTAANGKGDKEDDDNSSSSKDDVPATHDEL